MTEEEKKEIIKELRSDKEFLIFMLLLILLNKLEEKGSCACASEGTGATLENEPLEVYHELQRDDRFAD